MPIENITVKVWSEGILDSVNSFAERTVIPMTTNDDATEWVGTKTIAIIGNFDYAVAVTGTPGTEWRLRITQEGVDKPLVDEHSTIPEGSIVDTIPKLPELKRAATKIKAARA